MALDLIVFDCDGVILESMDIKTKAFYRIGKEISEEAAEGLLAYHNLNGGVSRFKKFEWLYATYKSRAITDEEKEVLNEQFKKIALEEIARCPLVPGVQGVLERWLGRVPMYVASGAPEEELRMIIQNRGLSKYFVGVYGSPTVKTQLLRIIVQHAGVKPCNAIMIGDARTDQYAAEAVGTRFYGRGEYFKPSGHPWHEDLTQLNEYLEELSASP
ncbi:MAG: HAD hydrolase-like protein [Desulfovibrionaceae bacterium]|nr:HAD hydrolase-like protein [Desulfovibrionaceae bacterium]